MDLGMNNLHSLITFAEIERLKKPGRRVDEEIMSNRELLGLMISDLKQKYKNDACSDLAILKGLKEKIIEVQNRYVDELDLDKGIRVDDIRNSILIDMMDVNFTLLEVASRNEMWDKIGIPQAEVPESTVMRRRN